MPDSPWGPLLAAYFVLVGLPSGLTLVSCWRTLRWARPADRADQLARFVALVALLLVGVLLVVDLGRPERWFLMLTRFDNLTSPVAVGAKLIAVKVFLLGVDLYLFHRGRGPGGVALVAADRRTAVVARLVTWSLAGASLALAIYPMAVLARTWVSPLSGTGGAALVFLMTSLLMGVAAYLIIGGLVHPRSSRDPLLPPLRAVAIALLAGHVIALGFEALAVVGDARLAPAVTASLGTTAGAILLWGLCLGVGVLLPAGALALAGARQWLYVGSGAAVLVGACASRYLMFAAGQ